VNRWLKRFDGRAAKEQYLSRRWDATAKARYLLKPDIELFREASELPERDRATLAGLLIESLEAEPEPDVEAAWSEEIKRRVAELDAGNVETIPWEEVRQRLLDRLNEREVPPCSGGRGRTSAGMVPGTQRACRCRILQELTRAIQRIRLAPERYPAAEHGTRRILLEQFPLQRSTWCGVRKSSSWRSHITQTTAWLLGGSHGPIRVATQWWCPRHLRDAGESAGFQ